MIIMLLSTPFRQLWRNMMSSLPTIIEAAFLRLLLLKGTRKTVFRALHTKTYKENMQKSLGK